MIKVKLLWKLLRAQNAIKPKPSSHSYANSYFYAHWDQRILPLVYI